MNKFSFDTPVVLMIFRRPDLTRRVLDSIRQAKPSQLLVVGDGPRADKPGEREKCEAARAVIKEVDWDCKVLTNYADVNLGCRQRVHSGISWAFEHVEEAIILEDDCVPHPTFFRFCQELLTKYRDDDRVMLVSGDNAHRYQGSRYSYHFSQYALIWGWATWRSAWQHYDNSMAQWPKLRDENWLETFMPNQRAVDYWTKIMQDNYEGYSSWARAWMFTCWRQKGLCAVPRRNLIGNIGYGEDSTHTFSKNNKRADADTMAMDFPLYHPPQVERDRLADKFIEQAIFSVDPHTTIAKQALNALESGNFKQSLSLFNKGLKTVSNSSSLNYGKAVALAQLERPREAVDALDALLKQDSENRKARLLRYQLQESMWHSWMPPKAEFEAWVDEFIELYQNRPIETNDGGIKSIGAFSLWFFLRRVKPKLVIESGVYRGQTTWIIEQAVPEAKIICFDPNPKIRSYTSKAAEYQTEDFKQFDFEVDLSEAVAFFDDNQNIYERVLQAHEKGFAGAIVNNNYLTPPPEKVSLQSCVHEGKERAKTLTDISTEYIVFPPLFKPKNTAMEKVATESGYVMNEALNIFDNDPKYELFREEINTYRWLTYVAFR